MIVQSWIIFILSSQIILIGGETSDQDLFGGGDTPDDSQFVNYQLKKLEGGSQGLLDGDDSWDTHTYDKLSQFISEARTSEDGSQSQFRVTSNGDNLLANRIILRQLDHADDIIFAELIFIGDDGNFLRDDDGNPITYKSTRQELGHLLEILHQDLVFSYIQYLLHLRPNSKFDLHSLLFFTARQPPERPAVITGPTLVSLDSPYQTYNVSTTCPADAICMWSLDDVVIGSVNTTLVNITFLEQHIGNRTLKYTAYTGGKSVVLATLPITISANRKYVCNGITRTIKNKWLPGGNMSSPRVMFTATAVDTGRYIIIAGGLTDGYNVLSTVDIYNTVDGCYNLSNITVPRMGHAAAKLHNSDVVLVIGGSQGPGSLLQSTEPIPFSSNPSVIMLQHGRYAHEVAALQNGNVLVSFGQAPSNTSALIEIYERSTNAFRTFVFADPSLRNIQGHSITSLGSNNSALIFGGFNGRTYTNKALLIKTKHTESVTHITVPHDMLGRAHHQATYIADYDVVLITGGDNGTTAFSSCYLYDIERDSFAATGSMNVRRSFHTNVLLPNGSVLVIGGISGFAMNQPDGVLRSVEMYDPASGTFSPVSPLLVPRFSHEAAITSTGEIFIMGGSDAYKKILSSIEYFVLEADDEY